MSEIEGSATTAPGDVIDVHAHYVPDCYRSALTEAGLTQFDGGMTLPDWSPSAALKVMDGHGIATAILSVSSPGLTFLAADREAALARDINQTAATLIKTHTGRFGAFATLPLGDRKASLAEIDHAFDVVGLDGVIMETNHHGTYLGASELAPIYAALNARGAAVFIHPTSPTCLECLSCGRPAPMIEFPFETTRTVVDLLYSGTLARYPDIRFILSHAGGALPFLAQRIAGFAAASPDTANGLTPAEIIAQLSRLFYDTALSATPVQIQALRSLVPASQILFGSDWPFSPVPVLDNSLSALAKMAEIDPAERAMILTDNARRLFPRHDSRSGSSPK